MNTADFMPNTAFEQHLERRRTTRRIAFLMLFMAACLAGAFSVTAEAKQQRRVAELAEAPSSEEIRAGQELEVLYSEMNQYSSRLDSLSDHLRMPTMGSILAELAGAVGEYVLIEKIEFKHNLRRIGSTKIKSAEVHLDITVLVRGDENLINLPQRLQQFTSFKYATIAENTELIDDMNDTVRAKIHLRGELLMPGFDKVKMHKEAR
ncbi:MAG: hypothetical protein H8E25_13055 [Planctomycetes bacterium]|nr:hypothetical protein [Planctomycetota bacterium]